MRAHLASALELLRPAVSDAAGVERRLDEDDAAAERAARNPLLRLSTREYEIVQLIARGMGNKEIAAHLAIAPTTVSTHRARIMEKLQVYLKLMRLSKKGDAQQAYPGGVNGETEILIPIG